MKKAVIFDIDGTLADISHRRPYLMGERPDWRKFNDEMGADLPNIPVVELYKTLWDSGKYDLILTSGRYEASRKLTENWLFWNNIPFSKIYMRKNGDTRADFIIKQEFLTDIENVGAEILFAVDDRQQVVDMWRRNGIVCLQCDEGKF